MRRNPGEHRRSRWRQGWRGCDLHPWCSEEGGTDTGKIRGGIRRNAPASLQVHFAHVNGGVRMRGGNGFFSTVEDNVIHGGATIDGYSGFWLGFIRNSVHGT